MKKAKKQPLQTVVNRRARFDYELGEDVVAGIVLTGPEVRAARTNRVQLKGAFVTVKDNELWLNNTSFSVATPGETAVDTTPRKLLVHRKQLDHFKAARQNGMTIVPTKLIPSGKYIKVVIALAKGKKNYDKRQAIKRRDQERESRRLT